jgi:hypothetical protein
VSGQDNARQIQSDSVPHETAQKSGHSAIVTKSRRAKLLDQISKLRDDEFLQFAGSANKDSWRTALNVLEEQVEVLPPVATLPRLVGPSGFARSGKDTAAQWLVEQHGFAQYAIADPLREILRWTNPVVRASVTEHGWEVAKRNARVRNSLQMLGAALRDQFGDDFLIDQLFDRAARSDIEMPIVISDVRTRIEVDYIKRRGGVVLRIERPGIGPANNDFTERIVPFDVEVLNDGSVEQLGRCIVRALRLAEEE